MDLEVIGALIATFLIVSSTLIVSLNHAAQIDKERHIKSPGH